MTFDEILMLEDQGSEVNTDSFMRRVSEDAGEGAAAVLSNDAVDETGQEDGGEDTESDEEDSHLDIIQRLENIMLDFLTQLVHAMPSVSNSNQARQADGKIAIELTDRKKRIQPNGSAPTRQLTFPHGGKHASSRSIAQFLRVVELMHEALVTGIPTTKRDMYYKDVPLFGSQAVIDRLVDDVAATIGVKRADLNVRAASKGLVSGRGLTMHLHTAETITVSPSESTLIPPSEEIKRYEVQDDLSWVLIVEKEAVFQTLCRLNIADHPDLPGPGLIITGKGYPDVATRQLACTLSENLPMTIPILALVDCDPYGIDILSVYKYGSTSMFHEQESLIAPRLTWAGVKSEDIVDLGLDRDTLIPMTKHDRKKALAMLRRPDLPKRWKKELQHMLHSRRKAEIEILASADWAVLGAQPQYHTSEGGGTDDTGATSCRNGLRVYVVKKINQAVNKSVEKFGS